MTNVGTRELRGRSRPEDQSWLTVITRPNYYFLILSPAAPVTRGVVLEDRRAPGNRVQGYQRLSQECKISDGATITSIK